MNIIQVSGQQSVLNKLWKQYPIDILREIFTYDDTYIDYFKTHVLKELSIYFFLTDQDKSEFQKKYILEVKDSKIGHHWFYIAQYYETNQEYYLLDIVSGYRSTSFHIWRTKEQLQHLDYVKIWNEDVLFLPDKSFVNIPRLIRYRYMNQVLWLMDDDYVEMFESDESNETS